MLYSLAEVQAGHATTIKVTADGRSFGISDDGRGHSIARAVEGASYLKFIYTHFDYPFDSASGAPIQLQGIGMSLINAMCSELALTVRNKGEILKLLFRDGRLHQRTQISTTSAETGNAILAKIDPRLQQHDADTELLEVWLLEVLKSSPSLKLFLNGRELLSHQQ